MKARSYIVGIFGLMLLFLASTEVPKMHLSSFESTLDDIIVKEILLSTSELVNSSYSSQCLGGSYVDYSTGKHCCFYLLNTSSGIYDSHGIANPLSPTEHRKDVLEYLYTRLNIEEIIKKAVREALSKEGYDPNTAVFTVDVTSQRMGNITDRVINHTTGEILLECFYMNTCNQGEKWHNSGTDCSTPKPDIFYEVVPAGSTTNVRHAGYSLPRPVPQDTLEGKPYPGGSQGNSRDAFGVVRGLFPCIEGPANVSEDVWLKQFGLKAYPSCANGGTCVFDLTGKPNLIPAFNYTVKSMRGARLFDVKNIPLNKTCVEQMMEEIMRKVGPGNNHSYLLFRVNGIWGIDDYKVCIEKNADPNKFGDEILVNWTCNDANCLLDFTNKTIGNIRGNPCVIQCRLVWKNYSSKIEHLASEATAHKRTLLLNSINVFTNVTLNYGLHTVTSYKKLERILYRVVITFQQPFRKTFVRDIVISYDSYSHPVKNYSGVGVIHNFKETLKVENSDPIMGTVKSSGFLYFGEEFYIDSSTIPTNNDVVNPYEKDWCWVP